MSTEAKTPQILLCGWAALLTRAIGSGFLHLGQRLNAIILWARARVVAIEWNAMLERQRAKKVAREKEARLARHLSELTEAVVLLDDKHRLIKANQNALCLLGLSQRNISKFTLDTFLCSKVPGLPRMGRAQNRKSDRWRACEIRRLDGTSMVAEIMFQSNVGPGKHLSRIRNVRTCRHVPSQIQARL